MTTSLPTPTDEERDEVTERATELHRIAYQQARKAHNPHAQAVKIADDVVKEFRREQTHTWALLDDDAFWTQLAQSLKDDDDDAAAEDGAR